MKAKPLPDPIRNAAADGPVILTEENQKKAAKAMKDMMHSLKFFYDELKSGMLYKSGVKTHIALLRYGFNDLNELLDGGQFLSGELEMTKKQLREANKKIDQLEHQAGEQVTALNGQSFLDHMGRALATWYELSGFHYGTETVRPQGIELDMSEDIDYPNEDTGCCDITCGRNAIAEAVAYRTPWQFKSGFDLHKEERHLSLLDTDKNRRQLQKLFKSVFPNSRVTGFRSRPDRKRYLLRVSVYIPFTDIEDWLKRDWLKRV